MSDTTPRLGLVTGGAGFIGSHIVDALLAQGWRVRVLDDLSTGHRSNISHALDRIDFVEGSIVDPATCARACRDVDTVFHQAAIPSVPRSVSDPGATHAACSGGPPPCVRRIELGLW